MLTERIQERLTALGISANKASVDAGLGRDYVRDILRGKIKEPSADRLVRLASILKCQVLYLLGDVDEVAEAPGPVRRLGSLPVLFRIRPGFHEGDEGAVAGSLDWPVKPLTVWPTEEWLEVLLDPERGHPLPKGSLLHINSRYEFEDVKRGDLVVVTRVVPGTRLIERSVRAVVRNGVRWELEGAPDAVEAWEFDEAAFRGEGGTGLHIRGRVMAIYQYLDVAFEDLLRG